MFKPVVFAVFAALSFSNAPLALADDFTSRKVVCFQNREFSPIQDNTQIALVMEKLAAKNFYSLTVYRKTLGARQPATVLFTGPVKASAEDVVVQLNDRSRSVYVQLYLDELNQSFVRAPGVKVTLNCKIWD